MKNKNILLITYHFPPEGGPSVQRILKFAKYLPEYNYIPFVLTTNSKPKIVDNSLINDIPKSLRIYRVTDIGKFIPGEIKNKFKSSLFFPDKQSLWKIQAVNKGIEFVNKNNIDLIFSTSPPHSVHLMAKAISQKTKKPWIADFRDEWTSNPTFYKNKKRKKHQQQEDLVLQRCNHLTTTTFKSKDNFSKKMDRSKITVIQNGFDPEDFKQIKNNKQSPPKKIIIKYCGRFNTLHSPKILFSGFSELLKNTSGIKTKLQFDIIGNIENKKHMNNFPELKDMVKFHPYQQHQECINQMSKATMLILLATNTSSTEFIPAKVYEYFALKKPIFAILSSHGELSKLLTDYSNSYIYYEDNREPLAVLIKKIIKDWEDNNLNKPVQDAFINQHSRKFQTQKLSTLFSNILGKQ